MLINGDKNSYKETWMGMNQHHQNKSPKIKQSLVKMGINEQEIVLPNQESSLVRDTCQAKSLRKAVAEQ